ncbi:MAG: T9SS type A sorting domain-containing protein [Bacteroidales bacterium]|nr:T9SS type A sorting domain-containing protein [Bacteroidales bacterium]
MNRTRLMLLLISVVVITGAGSALYLLNRPQQDARVAFEDFLHRELSKLPTPEVNLKEIPKADRPDMAALQNYYQTLDPQLGYVPFKRQYAAYQQTQAIARQQAGNRELTINWQGTQAEMGGRTRALMFDPNDIQHKKVWAAGITGGLWFTQDITNLSSQWYPLNDFWPNLAVSCITYDPADPLVFYAGTGEAQTARIIYRESTGLGIGIMKSVDGGETWEQIPSTADFAYITDLKVRVENGLGVLYAGVASGTYQGEDHISEPSDGLYRSTDGGESWTQVLPAIPSGNGAYYAPASIEISASNRIFVGTMENLNQKGGATVLWSDQGTAGSWTSFTDYNTLISGESYYNIPARTLVASAPSNPNIVYAQFAGGYTSGFSYYRGRYMARSTDGGQSWSPMTIPDVDWSTLAWHAFVLKVDPTNPDAVFTGGLDLWKTMNAGLTWSKISDWVLMYYGGGDEYVHADQHNIAFRPNNPSQAIFSSDGGVFLSETANLDIPIFMERNQQYNTLQFYSCAIHPTAGTAQYLGGLQDNGTLKYSGSPLSINSMISGGDGAYCFWDQNQPNIYVSSVYYNSYYSWQNNVNVNNFGGNSGTFVCPADYDYKLNNLYANAVSFAGENPGRLYRATNLPIAVSESFVNLGTMNTIPFSAVTCSPHSPTGKTTLFVGTQSGRLYKVNNAQDLPQTVDIGSTSLPAANISSIAVGGSEDTLLVTFSNYGVASVWQTYDGGNSWQNREGNLPDMPIRWAIYHPQNSGQAMLATETGIWVTNKLRTGENEWMLANDGMANVRVDMLRIRESDMTVIAATHGRGLFTCTWDLDVYVGIDPLTENAFSLSPNPATNSLLLTPQAESKDVSVNILDMGGHTVMSAYLGSFSTPQRIDISRLPAATYVLVVKSDGRKTASRKFVKSPGSQQ